LSRTGWYWIGAIAVLAALGGVGYKILSNNDSPIIISDGSSTHLQRRDGDFQVSDKDYRVLIPETLPTGHVVCAGADTTCGFKLSPGWSLDFYQSADGTGKSILHVHNVDSTSLSSAVEAKFTGSNFKHSKTRDACVDERFASAVLRQGTSSQTITCSGGAEGACQVTVLYK
jgi:hypothetical protein